MIVPTPWRLVEDRAVILGRDGQPVQLGGVSQTGAGMTVIGWNGAAIVRPSDEIVPVVLPDMGRALGNIFAAFPGAQVLQITDM
jgi:hypothetical protein